jgi:hypothetical protein
MAREIKNLEDLFSIGPTAICPKTSHKVDIPATSQESVSTLTA